MVAGVGSLGKSFKNNFREKYKGLTNYIVSGLLIKNLLMSYKMLSQRSSEELSEELLK